MSRAPELSGTPCPRDCGALLHQTFDAIGRPRARCARCDGVNFATAPHGTVGHLHCQTAESSRDLAWPTREARCRDCGTLLVPDGRAGRRRAHCADRAACARRRSSTITSLQTGTAA